MFGMGHKDEYRFKPYICGIHKKSYVNIDSADGCEKYFNLHGYELQNGYVIKTR